MKWLHSTPNQQLQQAGGFSEGGRPVRTLDSLEQTEQSFAIITPNLLHGV